MKRGQQDPFYFLPDSLSVTPYGCLALGRINWQKVKTMAVLIFRRIFSGDRGGFSHPEMIEQMKWWWYGRHSLFTELQYNIIEVGSTSSQPMILTFVLHYGTMMQTELSFFFNSKWTWHSSGIVSLSWFYYEVKIRSLIKPASKSSDASNSGYCTWNTCNNFSRCATMDILTVQIGLKNRKIEVEVDRVSIVPND